MFWFKTEKNKARAGQNEELRGRDYDNVVCVRMGYVDIDV